MAEYIPVFKPGEDITQTAGADIVGGRLVAVTGANTVTETAGATAAWLGVATVDTPAGAKVAVTSGGVQELEVSGAVVAGDVVIPAADGRVAPIAGGSNYAQVVGIALTAQSTVGQRARVRMVR